MLMRLSTLILVLTGVLRTGVLRNSPGINIKRKEIKRLFRCTSYAKCLSFLRMLGGFGFYT